MKTTIKSLALISMGVFLYSRFWNGKLFFYINERFMWLTIFASIGFLLIGISYRYRSPHRHDHDHAGHTHGQVSWVGLAILLSPIALGLLIPPKPLGAAAMLNRDVSLESLTSASNPTEVLIKPKVDKNILDWLIELRSSNDPTVFDGETIQLTGFVYRDDRFGENNFMISRFVLSCCAADAAPLGLIVAWPGSGELPDDQWVDVSGHLQAGEFIGETIPIIIADTVTLTEIPNRPYLYPF